MEFRIGSKVVVFDLFQTLISEFDGGRPSITEVAQTLQLPVEDFQREYVNHPSEVADRVRGILVSDFNRTPLCS